MDVDAEQMWADLIQGALQQAVVHEDCKVQDTVGNSLVTKWAVVVEMMDDNGEKWITAFRGPSPSACPMWDAYGLFQYAIDNLEPEGQEEDDS